MRKYRLIKSISLLLIAGVTGYNAFANPNNEADVKVTKKNDDKAYDLYNPKEYHILDLKKIWLELHLQETTNLPFFNDGKEITRHLIKGVIEGKIIAYKDENCTQPMSKDDFIIRLKDPNIVSNNEDNEFKTTNNKTTKESIPSEDERLRPKDISIIKLKVTSLKHNLYSEHFLIIDSVTMIVPAHKTPGGVDLEIATFDYRNLIEYFDSISPDESYIDSKNISCNMKFSEALKQPNLWFPQSYYVDSEEKRIRKYSPPADQPLDLKKTEIIADEAYLWCP